jgi:DNA-binding transcriptional LysR family regulator
MHLDRLRTFTVLSETLHFRRTAELLHVSQSAVSQQIATLEAELGVMLLERIGRRVFLTPAGRLLAVEAARVLAGVERAVEAVRALGTGETGRLRLGASTMPGVYVLPAVLGAARRALPHLQLEFRIANSAAVVRGLVDNSLDLGIIGEEVTQPELFHVAVGHDVVIGVAARSLIGGDRGRGGRRRLRQVDLARLPLLGREAGSATQRLVDAALARLGVAADMAFELPSPEAQVRAAAAGLGLAFVSRRVAALDLAAGRLIEIGIDGLRLTRPIIAAHHRDKRITPAMKQVVELVRHHARAAS